MCMEGVKDSHFLQLASTTAKFLSDPTVQGFWAKQDTEITYFVTTCNNAVQDVLAQVYLAPTGEFSLFSQLVDSDSGKLLLGSCNPDSSNGGYFAVTTGSGLTSCSAVVLGGVSNSCYS